MKKTSTILMAAASTLALGATAYAAGSEANDESARIEIGYLECDLIDEDNNIIVSDQIFTCVFDPAEDGFAKESYSGKITKIGLDLSATDEERIRWAVLATADKENEGVLEGEYGGVSADAALGVGGGAKVLVGGVDESIALQPVSLTGQTGIGVALSIENLTLTYTGEAQ